MDNQNMKNIKCKLDHLKNCICKTENKMMKEVSDDTVENEWKFKFVHEPGHYEVITMKSFDDLKDLFDETKEELVVTFDENEFSDEDKMNEVDGIIMPKSKADN